MEAINDSQKFYTIYIIAIFIALLWQGGTYMVDELLKMLYNLVENNDKVKINIMNWFVFVRNLIMVFLCHCIIKNDDGR